MKNVKVRRSGWKMWGMAIGAIPLLVIGVDVLTNRRLTNWLREQLFRPDETQIYEPRDVIWAWAMVFFAGIVVLWALKELFAPTSMVEAQQNGLALKLRGPFRRTDLIPWDQIRGVRGSEIDDEGEILPLLAVEVVTRGNLPEHPWGARWLDERVIGILAQDWPQDPSDLADGISDYAIAAVSEEQRKRTASVWEEE